MDREKELQAEIKDLKKEKEELKKRIERYREIEVELSTEVDLLSYTSMPFIRNVSTAERT